MVEDCVFCKIINKEIPSKQEYEDDLCLAFHDINPRSKTHILVVPKKHIPTMKEVEDNDKDIMGNMLIIAKNLAKKFNLEDYKILISTGKKGGQEVFHVHLHLMSAPE
jgi:histidine triad (HIT) family protein